MPAVSPVEFVKGLSDEEKEAIFLALAEEGIADGPEPFAVPLERDGGPVFGYLLSAKEYDALQQQYQFPHANNDDYEAKRVPQGERNWVAVEEAMEWLDEEDEEEDGESSPPPGAETVAAGG